MQKRVFVRAACIVTAVLATSIGLAAEPDSDSTFNLRGTINDFTATLGSSGPWHINGEWSLRIQGHSGKADFAAAIAMVRSDLWVINALADADNPAARAPHTHHVVLTAAEIAPIANGFRISGTADITSNGSPAGFTGSPVEVEITGNSAVAAANVKLTFLGAAAAHFGAQPLDGVVTEQH